MDKPTIQAAVWHAADQLFAAGIRPTVANVREITRRGSAGTINQALKEWWRALSLRVNNKDRRPELPEPVADAMCQLWATSLDRAEHAMLAYREDADRQVTEANTLLASAEKSRAHAEQRCGMLEKELAALQLSSAELQRTLAAESALRNASDSRIRSIREEATRAMADMQASLKRMEKQCELEKRHYETMERNLTAQADESKLLRQQTERRLADLQAQATTREQAQRSEILDYKERCARQAERNELLEQRIVKLEFELVQAAEKIHALIGENTMLKSVPSRAPVDARIAHRFKATRAKKRRL